jgi:NAD(P)H-dependent FMN reductase
MTTTIVGIAGSLRKDSHNAALLRAAAEMTPTSCRVEIASIRDIPLFDGDVEREAGVPEPVKALKDRIAVAQGLLLVTPEYNHSIPGVLKNAIDWLSRPPADMGRVFRGLPTGLIGATPGKGGTRFAQAAWLPVLRALGVQPWFGKSLYVAEVGGAFDEGELVDADIQKRLQEYMTGFVKSVKATVR